MNETHPLHGGESTDAGPAPCWACGAPDPAPQADYPGFLRCGRCGLLFTPVADPEELRRLYGEDYFAAYCAEGGYDADPAQREREAALRVALIRADQPSGRVLEIGSAGGYCLAALRNAGYEPVGIEPGAEIAEASRARFGVDVRTGLLGEVPLDAESFDAVCGWHVLEHIPEPVTALREAARLLRPGGKVFIEVPNAASVRARRDGPAWHALEPLHHVSNFTPAALRAALEAAGFADVRTETVSFQVYLTPRARLAPRALVGLLKEARDTHRPLRPDPERHELLRAVAVRPGAQGT